MKHFCVLLLIIYITFLNSGCSESKPACKLLVMQDLEIETLSPSSIAGDRDIAIRVTNSSELHRFVKCTILFTNGVERKRIAKTVEIRLYPHGTDCAYVSPKPGESLVPSEIVALEVSNGKSYDDSSNEVKDKNHP